MKKRFHVVSWFTGITVLIMLALLIAPSTRLIMKLEFRAAILREGSIFHMDNMEQVAARYPDDMNIQIAGVFSSPHQNNIYNSDFQKYKNSIMQSIHKLIARFPNQAEVYAAALKQLSLIGVNIGRDRAETVPPNNSPILYKIPKPDIALLNEFDNYCTAGENLDPQNAYFHYMRSIALFAMRRDAEALKEIEAAGEKPLYNDYTSQELNSLEELTDRAAGGKSAFLRTSTRAETLFPEYARMRESARIAIHEAILLEMKGDYQGGFVIRRAVRRYGSLMTSDATMTIGNLVGGAISELAMNYFPGAPPAENQNRGNYKNFSFLIPYVAYLERIHQPEEAAACQEQVKRLNSMHSAIKMNDLSYNLFLKDCSLWLAGTIALMSAYWVVLTAVISILAQRIRPAKLPKSLPDSIKFSLIIIPFVTLLFELSIVIAVHKSGILPIIIILFMFAVLSVWMWKGTFADGDSLDVPLMFLWLLTILIGGLLLYWPDIAVNEKNILLMEVLILISLLLLLSNKLTQHVQNRFHTVSTLLLRVAFIGLFLSLFDIASGWQINGVMDSFNGLGGQYNSNVYVCILPVLIPQILLIAFGLVSYIRHEPFLLGFSRRMRAFFLPITCVILIIWSGILMATLLNEQKMNEWQKMINMSGELQSSARLSNVTWPGIIK